MKIFPSVKILAALACSAALATLALAHEAHNKNKSKGDADESGSLIKVAAADVSAEWLAKATAEYPLDACMVSEDKLEDGEMGPPQDFVYRQDGAPDRLVRLCCNHCVRDFKKEPAKYLQAIADAAAAKAKAKAGSAK